MTNNNEIIRAWKDPKYRKSVRDVQPLPIGDIELDDPYLVDQSPRPSFAGRRGEHTTVFGCPTHFCTGAACETVAHCPHTGWQCKGIRTRIGFDIG